MIALNVSIVGFAICVIASLIPSYRCWAENPSRIWLAPLPPHDVPNGGRAGSEDYMTLFTPDADWRTVARHVSVFKIYLDFAQHASDDEISRLVSGLRARNIDLAVEAPVLTQTAWCQADVPERKQIVAPLMARLKSLGADIHYLAMAGPLVDGHTFTKEFYCHRSIEDVASDAARTVALVRAVFPNIIVGDIEPVGHHDQYPAWSELDSADHWVFRAIDHLRENYEYEGVISEDLFREQLTRILDNISNTAKVFMLGANEAWLSGGSLYLVARSRFSEYRLATHDLTNCG